MSDPEQNRLTACQKFFVSKKNPCGVPFIPPHGFVFLSVRAVAFGESAERRPGTYPAERMPLSLESDESESLQMLFANIRGQIGFRACRCDLCNRPAYALPYRGCQKGVDVARMRPAEYDCHARDLSALVDLVSHGCEEVGTGRKQRVKVGHHAVLPDEAMGPVEVGVPGASHHLALAVDAGGYGGKISRQSAEVCDCAVLPKRAILGCAVRTADCPNNLALVDDAGGYGGKISRQSAEVCDCAVLPKRKPRHS